jgi:septum formation protein
LIDAYLDRGDYQDKAGAYAIQDIGAKFVSAVDGDYDNVVGFPVSRIGAMLAEMLRFG